MALWLVRAGRYGEHMQHFLDTNRVYVTWGGMNRDLSTPASKPELNALLAEVYPNMAAGRRRNNTGQLWPFAHEMKPGDWVVVPYKTKPAFNIAEITGPYIFTPTGPDPYYHSRTVRWVVKDVPRSNFDQDILYSLGAFMTICQIERNDAENRVRAMEKTGWKSSGVPSISLSSATDGDGVADVDLEELARDQIARLIIQRFKGHGLAWLVEAVLKAQGYTTYRSPEGPDKGIDLLAAPGPLGFGRPRLCVQVKSSDSPVDHATLNQLIGAMANVQAEQGLLVSWGGFKTSVEKEIPTQFFRVRVWDRDALIEELLSHYDKLDADVRAELPLKHIWTVAVQDEEE